MAKLVRDNIVQIIKNSGKKPIYRVCSSKVEKRSLLLDKLQEETDEVKSAKTDAEVLEELADVYEVLLGLASSHGFTEIDLYARAKKKRAERGGFEKGHVLLKVEE